MGVLQGLKHSKLVVDHLLVALDVLLEDDLDSYPPRGALGLSNDAIGAGTECLSEPVFGPIESAQKSAAVSVFLIDRGRERVRTSCRSSRAGRPAD